MLARLPPILMFMHQQVSLYILHRIEIGEDYSLSFPFVITYSAGGPSEACTDITIVNDASLEGHHNFSVEITSTTLSPNAVQIPSLPLLIQIQDDDRKCHLWLGNAK